MKQIVIENPVINTPFEEPKNHFRFTDEGITNEIDKGRPVATNYNLNILEEYGFVSSKYEISEAKKSKWRALRIYKVTDKVDAVLSEFKKL
ncbi:MAG TPA: hypothetical protein VMW40_02285 [Candidatus Bathyarchaeia archaeon]|nr:hypothetical protein [Candidatus Bathyarchaeia archaeon]